MSINNAFIRDTIRKFRGENIMNAFGLSLIGVFVLVDFVGLGIMLYDRVKYGQG